jgi:hypothetical protein
MRTLEHFHKSLYGQEFHLRTDDSALTWLLKFKNLEGQTVRWIQRLQECDFSFEHRQGWKHKNADPLKVERADVKQLQAISAVAIAGLNPAALRTEVLNDPHAGPIMEEVETVQRPELKDITGRSPTHKRYWTQWRSHALRNYILERNWESAD